MERYYPVEPRHSFVRGDAEHSPKGDHQAATNQGKAEIPSLSDIYDNSSVRDLLRSAAGFLKEKLDQDLKSPIDDIRIQALKDENKINHVIQTIGLLLSDDEDSMIQGEAQWEKYEAGQHPEGAKILERAINLKRGARGTFESETGSSQLGGNATADATLSRNTRGSEQELQGASSQQYDHPGTQPSQGTALPTADKPKELSWDEFDSIFRDIKDDNLDQRIQKYKEQESTVFQGQKQEYWIKMLEKEHRILTGNDGIRPISDDKKDKRNREWIAYSLPKLLEIIPKNCKSECTKLLDEYIHQTMEREKNQLLSSIHDSYYTGIGTLEKWSGEIKRWLESLPPDYRNKKYGGKEFEREKSGRPLTEEEITARLINKLLVEAISEKYNYGGPSTRTINLDVPTQQLSQESPKAHGPQALKKDLTQQWVEAQSKQGIPKKPGEHPRGNE